MPIVRGGDVRRTSRRPPEPGTEPDYRFSLANERTFLAYLRTALALDAGGLAVVQLLSDVGTPSLRRWSAVILIVLGTLIAVAGYHRCRANQRAMRMGAPLPASRLTLLLTVLLVVVSILAVVLVLAG
jgi:putative membrane protein